MNATANSTTTSSSRPRPARSRHVVLRHRLTVDGIGVPIIGGSFLLVVLAFTAVVSTLGDVRISGWETGTQLIRWFVGAMGVYLTAIYLPLYVAHGRTRREVAADSALFCGVYTVLVSVLVAVGFALEGVVYRIAGWTQALDNVHLFGAPDQYHLVFFEHLLVLTVWMVAGALVGAAFYRSGALGLALIPVGLAAVVAIELGTGPGRFALLPPFAEIGALDLGGFSPLGALTVALVSCLVLGAVTWRIVRDVPIRNRTD